MKIIKLEFENINSLKGKHCIDFDAEPLANAGLFLISGPTGSGKSTILDAITLALFNRIPRFSGSISRSKMISSGAVITHFESNASAAIVYESNGVQYTSRWSIEKNRNDNWNDYHMEVFTTNDGKIFDLKRSEVPSQNEALIGLTYDQFLKSILLAQGDFAQFLKSDNNSRGELLEKLTGTEIYRELGKLAYQKHKELVANLSTAQNEISAISILEEEVVLNINSELTALSSEKKILDKSINELSRKIEQLKRIKDNDVVIANISKTLNEHLDAIKAFQPNVNKLNNHNNLNPIRSELALMQERNRNVKTLLEDENGSKNELAVSKTQKEDAIVELSALTKTEVIEGDFMPVMKAFESNYQSVLTKTNLLKSRGSAIRNQIKDAFEYGMDNRLDARLSGTQGIEILDEIIGDYNRLKQELKFEGDDVNDALTKWSNEVNTLEKVQQVKLQVQKEKVHLNQIEADLVKHQKRLKSALAQSDTLDKELKALKIEKNEKQKLYLENQKSINLDAFRKALEKGAPCPLCGSIEHPYAQHEVIFEAGKLSLELDAIERALQKKEVLHKSNQEILISAKTHVENLGTQKVKGLTSLKEQEGVIAKYDEPIQALGSASLDARIVDIKKNLISLNAFAKKDKLINGYKILRQRYQEFQTALSDYANSNEALKKLFDGENLLNVTNRLQDQFTVAHAKIETSQAKLKDINDQLAKLNQTIEAKEKEIMPHLSKLGIQNIDAAQSMMLQDSEYQDLTAQQDQLNLKKNELNTKLSQLRDNQLKLKEEIKESDDLSALDILYGDKTKARDANQRKIGSHNQSLQTNAQNQKLKATKEKQIGSQLKDLEKWDILTRLIGDAQGNKFANYAQDLTLQTLIQITNKNLRLLSDRYVLKSTSILDDLAVYDTYQGDTVRSISTLSGGETFIVSLAMAVSLSELASRNVQIKSIFIDEGFGSLDIESLEQAVSTLELWQSTSDKTIGIISHVESLKERLTTKIQLQKNQQGYSNISILAS